MLKTSLSLALRQSTRALGEVSRCKSAFPSACYIHLAMKNPHVCVDASGVARVQILTRRNYAKGRDIKRDKKKKVQIDETELAEVLDVEKLFNDMSRPVNYFKQELAEHATLRSSHGAIENIKVKYEGQTYRLQDLAEIGKKNPKLFVLDFSSFPQVLSTVVNVLQTSELNLNVQQEGTKVFIPIPKVTKEHREALAKKSKAYFVKCKDLIRDVQMKYIKNLKNIENLSEETRFRVTEQLTALGDKQINEAEEILKLKQNELLKTD